MTIDHAILAALVVVIVILLFLGSIFRDDEDEYD